MENGRKTYFLGLDIGTDSVGYAVTNKQYDLIKFKGEPMWGVHLFEAAALNDERRGFRSARRRLDRRQQRIKLLQELFAKEIAKVDEKFFVRIAESALFSDDTTDGAFLFQDTDFQDKDYYRRYPTIHHLICELMHDKTPHDVRLVYLACAWLVAHRGHFLNEISKENIDAVLDIRTIYEELMMFFMEEKPWQCENIAAFGNVLKKRSGVNAKYRELCLLLWNIPKAPKKDSFPYNVESIVKALCGGKISAKELFMNEDYAEVESFSLDKADDELAPVLSALGDDAELIIKLKALFDWAVLSDVLQGEESISAAKAKIYEQHKKDLAALKYLIKKYIPKAYNEMFRVTNTGKVNYEAYAKGNSGKQEDFCKYAKSLLKDVSPTKGDEAIYGDVLQRLNDVVFCPKQVNSDNRVIPYQVYWVELNAILANAEKYLPFLTEVEEGLSVTEKILSIFEFRVPYFVGPLNSNSQFSWLKRKGEGKIYPWNFEQMVDLEASEQAFIDRMTNSCTYLPGEDVLPKASLCYEKFQSLNEINSLSVNGKKIPVEVKQQLFWELLYKRKRVTKKDVVDFLCSNNYYSKEDLLTISGVDDVLKSSLVSYRAFERLMGQDILSEANVEQIIARRTYTESKARFAEWLSKEYPQLSQEDQRYICQLKIKDFGRLSRTLLCDIYGVNKAEGTGEAQNILERMWSENVTLMELLSERYSYIEIIFERQKAYYSAYPQTLDERLKDMYISNAVKRPILRTLDIVADVVKANGCAPEKIFVEMARGGDPKEKGKRKKSRYQQIMELYAKCDAEDTRQLTLELENMGTGVESRLQSDKLFLYYMQLGKSMYSGKQIELSTLFTKNYDIDHIFPQSKVKDDSVLNNKVLVLSEENGEKGDVYPIHSETRSKMSGWWKFLHDKEFITDEKYKRLTRREPFSEAEQWGFINRQLVETRQSTKAIATILKEQYPDTQIVYVKAGLVSEFRQEFDLLKSRSVNDLHHTKDAYLNIVVGNVYNERFTRKWFLEHQEEYNLKVKTLFTHVVNGTDGGIVWKGIVDLKHVKNIVQNKNAIHMTRYAFCRKGGFFDQQPVKKAEGLIPRKQNLPAERYGGYNKPTASFFILVKYQTDKKTDLMLMPVELLYANVFLTDKDFAEQYAIRTIGEISGKAVTEISFPLGMRVIKVGTVFELDGKLRMYLTGKSSGGAKTMLSVFSPLVVGYDWETYTKRLEKLSEKKKENPSMVYSAEYDKVTKEENLQFYDILTSKLDNATYSKRPANPVDTLKNGRSKFEKLDVFTQTKCLMQILLVFGRLNNGCDLSAIGGVSKAAVCTMSSMFSNWKKKYTEVRIVDMPASGLYEKKSENLLELL